jgi:hypothetical protein
MITEGDHKTTEGESYMEDCIMAANDLDVTNTDTQKDNYGVFKNIK